MITLSNLKNTHRPTKKRKRVGRGPGSGVGKTCGRGEKGAGARAGYKRRWTYEGGQFRLFAKLPIRGFNNTRFRKAYDVVNLGQLEAAFKDGETVNAQTLTERGFLSGATYGIKILAKGELRKKVKFEVSALSRSAQEKLQKHNIAVTII